MMRLFALLAVPVIQLSFAMAPARGAEVVAVIADRITASGLGIASDQESIPKLKWLLQNDPSSLVRAQAAMSLGQLLASESIEVLSRQLTDDPSKDVRHQCELALDQIDKRTGVNGAMRAALESLPSRMFMTR